MHLLERRLYKCCACTRCTIQYSTRWKIDTKHYKTTHTSKNASRRNRIRNRMPRRTTTNGSGPHTINTNRKTETNSTHNGKGSGTAKGRNMQRRHPKTMGGRLVLNTKNSKRSPQRNGKTRVPLRPHSRSPRPHRPSKRRHPNKRRKTTPIPIRPKKTTTDVS